MRNVFILGLLCGACSLFGEKKDEPAPKPEKKLGTFLPGPIKDEKTGKSCSAPGGFCVDDGKCHSSPEKCLAR